MQRNLGFMACQMCTTANRFQWSKFDALFDNFDWFSYWQLILIRFVFILRRTRSFLCGLATANHYLVASLVTKTYFSIDTWLSLPGAILFYTVIGVIGYVQLNLHNFFAKLLNVRFVWFYSLIVMYFILPETEQRSLEDIELHFSDNSKGFTDIHIQKASESSGKWKSASLFLVFKIIYFNTSLF